MNAVAHAAPFRREPDSGIVAGVLSGLSVRFGTDPLLLRILFVIAVFLTGGLILLAYALAWAVVPAEGATASARERRPHPCPRPPGLARGLGRRPADALRAPGFPRARDLVERCPGLAGRPGRWRRGGALAPVARAGGARRRGVRAQASTPRASGVIPDLYKGGFGIALVVGAALLFLSANDALGGVRDAALAAIVAVLALALILAPFLWRMGRNLAAERAERIRSQERAELAAHLHDSVLQTLTLMQKRADDPREVATLARRQERELRDWLFDEERSSEAVVRRRAARRRRGGRGRARHPGGGGGGGRRRARRLRGGRGRRGPRGDDERGEVRARRRPGRAVRGGRERPPRGLRARPRPRFRPGCIAGRPPGRARVDRRAHGAPRRHGKIDSAPGEGTEVELVLDRSEG